MATKGKKTSDLQPISDLFKETWKVYKKTYISYLKIVGIGILLVIGGAIITVLFGLPLFISSGGSVDKLFTNTTGLQFFSIFLLFFWVLLYFIMLTVYSLVMPISYLQILTDTKKSSLKAIFKSSKQYLLPLFVTNLLACVLVLGGITLLVIPGLLICIFFSFTLQVIVLENKKGRAALSRSYQLVKAYFWQFFFRVLAVETIVVLISNVLNQIAKDAEVFSMLSQVFSILAEWFIVIYLFLLYKQIQAKVPAEKHSNMNWIWAVAAIGWIIIIGIIGAVLSGSLQLPSPDLMAS